MAYSCVEVWFEIGHEASVRTKRTPEGFTHDWEVFVRGVDNADINYFVEKVVFHLHETFPKPKRVIKEPPYSLKESGYAGFNLPIEVYFKNKDEPKKVKYHYDLHLQNSGPPISNIKREKYTFSNPSEDFRRKLIRGGGVGVLGSEAGGNSVSTEKTCAEEGTPSAQPTDKHSTPTLAGKPKLTSDPSKKAKIKETKAEEPRASNSFADLFGPPIKTAKVSPDPKKPSQSKVSPVIKNSKPVEKVDKLNSEKQYSAVKPKHIPQKEIKKEKDGGSRDEKSERKDKSKERERSKEKSSSKHPASSPPKLTKEESKKSSVGDHKEKAESKSSEVKSERKKEKKAKDEKTKRDKHKDPEKISGERSEKSEKHAKESKEKDQKKSPKHSTKDVEKVRDKEKHRDSDKERMKHRHKKREKEKYKKKDESREREKLKKAEEKENSGTGGDHQGVKRKRSESHSLSPSPDPSPILTPSPEKEPERPTPPAKEKPSKHPLSTLFAELEDHTSDSSSSPLTGDEDVIELPKLKGKTFSPRESKPEPVKEVSRVEEKQENFRLEHAETPDLVAEDVKVSKHKQSSHRDKSGSSGSGSKSKSKDKSLKKKEREMVESSVEEGKEGEKKKKKRSKRNREEEPVDEPPAKELKEDDEVVKVKTEKVLNESALKPPTADATSNFKPKFSKEYVSELLDLQKKIMTIKDDSELQRVVQVLAQSGKYEMNNKSFDVDLCALDKSTVKKLQEFFTVS